MMKYFLIFVSNCLFTKVIAFPHIESYNKSRLQKEYGGNLHRAIYDITHGFPTTHLSIVFDNATDDLFVGHLSQHLLENDISISLHNITTIEGLDEYFNYLANIVSGNYDLHTLYFCNHKMAEHILLELYDSHLVRNNLVFMFYWGDKKMYRYFQRAMHRNMKIVVITNPRDGAYRLYYNQATSHKIHHLDMYNWWIEGKGLFHHPTLPKTVNVFKNFNGRLIYVPVIHKPPWHFVLYTNNSFHVQGGRDDKLLKLLAERLNFRFEYFDPPERIQGTSFNANGTFDGILGLLWEREAEFFIGDFALTHERFKVVDFTFLTLADSGAFVTHAPSRLNEALALIRPFQWEVWPAIIVTVLIAGPALYVIKVVPNLWYPTFIVRDHVRFLFDCSWYTTGIFLKQTGKEPGDSHKCRFFIILLAISSTYVIGDMYAANLTSLLARPGRERAINDLRQLEEAMLMKSYKLMVEKHSSSYSLLENGTGIYERLWKLMNEPLKGDFFVDSVEKGVMLVKELSNVAVMAGRETLFFDIQRFGPQNFHLSEKLNTAYSAIALQQGCPYKENFNKILMGIFEAGILTKMTEDEYETFGKEQSKSYDRKPEVDGGANVQIDIQESLLPTNLKENRKAAKANEDNEKLQPINIRMLQGAFYLLCIGHTVSAFVLGLEVLYNGQEKKRKKRNCKNIVFFVKLRRRVRFWRSRAAVTMRTRFREAMNDAIIATLEYTE
ncbi:PREDICTED: glutamate receptor ionotropic, delta-2 [Nicrophorus vespilloides]|uniref:Glutamate receptor ionotropic, delta-2 n=1 Tax=Nicrophorus vespilloides TaxID=110193 RepID=A0ABM1M3X7_NICVS|nr:PREDICTED: glutamate receptor ionotropic, delta-2 [Nicrophorus vespilloides]